MIMRVRDESGNFIEVPLGSVSDEQIASAVEEYLTENPTEVTETDPTVPDWAKQPNKPTYTANEVGAYSTEEVNSIHTGLNVRIGTLEQEVDTKVDANFVYTAISSSTYSKTEVENLINSAIGEALEGDY